MSWEEGRTEGHAQVQATAMAEPATIDGGTF
jgi:hypothetical protein